MCFNQQKNASVVGLFRFSLSFVLACAAINRVNLAFRMTITEDTHLTLPVISFKVEANNSNFFCHYKHTRKNLPSFRSFTIYNSLVLGARVRFSYLHNFVNSLCWKSRNTHRHRQTFCFDYSTSSTFVRLSISYWQCKHFVLLSLEHTIAFSQAYTSVLQFSGGHLTRSCASVVS